MMMIIETKTDKNLIILIQTVNSSMVLLLLMLLLLLLLFFLLPLLIYVLFTYSTGTPTTKNVRRTMKTGETWSIFNVLN